MELISVSDSRAAGRKHGSGGSFWANRPVPKLYLTSNNFYYLRQEVLLSVVFVCWLGCLFVHSLSFLGPKISKTVRVRSSVPMDCQQEITYGESNGHVIDDVTWPWKVKAVSQIYLYANISKTAGDRGSVPKHHQYEMACRGSNGHVK